MHPKRVAWGEEHPWDTRGLEAQKVGLSERCFAGVAGLRVRGGTQPGSRCQAHPGCEKQVYVFPEKSES